jgi:hypothetical protein
LDPGRSVTAGAAKGLIGYEPNQAQNDDSNQQSLKAIPAAFLALGLTPHSVAHDKSSIGVSWMNN